MNVKDDGVVNVTVSVSERMETYACLSKFAMCVFEKKASSSAMHTPSQGMSEARSRDLGTLGEQRSPAFKLVHVCWSMQGPHKLAGEFHDKYRELSLSVVEYLNWNTCLSLNT